MTIATENLPLILRILLLVIIAYAGVVVVKDWDVLLPLLVGVVHESVYRHWLHYGASILILALAPAIWLRQQWAVLALGVTAALYLILSVILNYWPVVHVPIAVVLLGIAYFAYKAITMRRRATLSSN